jgi:GH25 family lysozyme M1 (1,4-beta-N-acetylmuramidase)
MLKGIDIARYQGKPDFKRVKAAGIRYVMLKATEGVDYIDPCFKVNAAAAIAAGLPIGVYHFLRSGSVADQVRDCLAAIKPYRIMWPVAVDVEHAELLTMGRDKLTDIVLDFCTRIKAAGYQPMVYSNYNWLYCSKRLDVGRIRAAHIPIWMAWYSRATPETASRSALCDIWQYASDGKVDGVTSNGLDMDVSYRDFGVLAVKSDTTCDITLAPGKSYIFKLTTDAPPTVAIGTAGVVTCTLHRQIGKDYLYRITAVGKPGTGAGIFANGKKQFVANIK